MATMRKMDTVMAICWLGYSRCGNSIRCRSVDRWKLILYREKEWEIHFVGISMSVAGAHERVNKISLQQKVKRNGRTSLIKLVPPFSDDSAPSDEAARGFNGASPASSSLPGHHRHRTIVDVTSIGSYAIGPISRGRFAFAAAAAAFPSLL